MSKPKYFQIFNDNYKIVKMLTDNDAGKLFKAIFEYVNSGSEPDFSANTSLYIVYTVITEQIKRDYEAYSKKCEQNRKNIKKRYSSTTVYERNQDKDKNKDKDKDEDKDKDKDKHSKGFGGTAAEECSTEFCDKVIKSYNEVCGNLPRVKKLTDKRRRLISGADRLLKEFGFNSFKEYFKKAAESCFLSGDKGEWQGCSFDWLLEENNLVRVAEGVFDNGRAEQHAGRSYDLSDIDRINTLDWIT